MAFSPPLVRDVGRTPWDIRIAKWIALPNGSSSRPPRTAYSSLLVDSITFWSGLKNAYENDARAQKRFWTMQLVWKERCATPEHMHAPLLFRHKKPLSGTPLQKATGDDEGVITQYSMKPLDEGFGASQNGFLGAEKILTIINENSPYHWTFAR